MNEQLKNENPWLSITSADDRLLKEDRSFFEQKFGSVENYVNQINDKDPEIKLTFSCLPDPFCGNPDSKVYCLNKNPGKPDPCFDGEAEYAKKAIDNLHLKAKDCFWAEGVTNRCGKEHDGVRWLRERTRKLEKTIGRRPNIFFIEYFPYHSSKGFTFPENLPSYEFSNKLIEQAIEDEKVIIIMRERANWLKRIKKLVGYQHLYTLKYPQGGYLTFDNIVRIDKNGEKFPCIEDTIEKYF